MEYNIKKAADSAMIYGFDFEGFQFIDNEKYQFHSVLGKGGYGTVFRITNRSGRNYACKVFNPYMVNLTTRYKNFVREAQIGINISHEHLVSFHKNFLITVTTELGEKVTFPAIIMDYVNGVEFKTFKKIYENKTDHRFPHTYAALILAKACSGLEHLHDLKIRHCDIKPGNILISQTGYPKITDYGIASLTGDDTQNAEISGTIRYMAPEQIIKISHPETTLDFRADIYSVGLVALEMTVGLPDELFGKPGPVLNYIVNKNQYLLHYVDKSHLSGDFKFLIRSCLDLDQERRPKNVRELQNGLLQTIYGISKGITLEDIGDEVKSLMNMR